MIILFLLALSNISNSCSPIQSSPLLPISINNQANIPKLPQIAFQMDNPLISPTDEDYRDNLVFTKDSIIPSGIEKTKSHFSLFDMFKPISTSTPITFMKLNSNVFLNLTISPPVHWTFCEPICGVGDQAVDAENAYENANDDIIEAIITSCQLSKIECDISSIDLKYDPRSILTEDFGAYFDLNGNRYRISGKTIAFRISSSNTGFTYSYQIMITIDFKLNKRYSEIEIGKLKKKIVDYIAVRKNLQIHNTTF